MQSLNLVLNLIAFWALISSCENYDIFVVALVSPLSRLLIVWAQSVLFSQPHRSPISVVSQLVESTQFSNSRWD